MTFLRPVCASVIHMPKYKKTDLDRDIGRLLSKASKKHLSPEDYQELTNLLQQLADLDDDGVDDGVDMDPMWALVAKAAKHRLSKADWASFQIGAAASPDQKAELAISIPAVLSIAALFYTSKILAEIPKTDGKGIKSNPFLVELAKAATANPMVFSKPIFFTTNNKKMKAIPFKPFSTMTQFTKHPHRGAVITLGLALVWTEKTASNFGEPDEGDGEVYQKEEHSVWVNKVRAERNSDGKCLELVLRWMVDLVVGGVDGLKIGRDTAGRVLKMKDFLPTPH
ncbi:hypothetical protein B0H14DRAFT_2594228 [Mycena olivaceomarginata]|nr:hypothetical protein B0H14DRAFT_2594228 [Mycena olivaceomarginata]